MSRVAATLALAGLAIAALSAPAFATQPPAIPEPTTLGLIAAGIVVGIVGYRMRRRK